jgi:hypothetical protein
MIGADPSPAPRLERITRGYEINAVQAVTKSAYSPIGDRHPKIDLQHQLLE